MASQMPMCANCGNALKPKHGGKGYYRFSLERNLSSLGTSARLELEKLIGQTLTPASKKSEGQFLCPQCWTLLNNGAKYKEACRSFLGKTSSPAYLAKKRPRPTSVSSPGSSLKRPKFTSTPLQHRPSAARSIFPEEGQSKRTSKWDTIVTAIRNRHFKRAIKGLYSATKATKRHFISVAMNIARQEVSLLLRKPEFPLAQDVTIPNIQEFSWEKTISDASETAPLLLGVLRGAITSRKNENTLVRGKRVQLKPKLGTILSMILHTKAPVSCKCLPTLLSVQLWRGRLRRDTMTQLSRLGICIGTNATLSAIDRIRAEFDAAAVRLKSDIEQSMQENVTPPEEEDAELSRVLSETAPNIEDEIVEFPELECDETILYSDGMNTSLFVEDDNKGDFLEDEGDEEDSYEEETENDRDNEEDVEEEEEEEEEDVGEKDEQDVEGHDTRSVAVSESFERSETGVSGMEIEESDTSLESSVKAEMSHDPVGFTFCWDNVGKKVITRRPTEQVKNRYINMALGYIAVNRVPSMHLPWKNENLKKAVDIPLAAFVPGQTEFTQLQDRMEVIVGRVLTRHLDWFRNNFSMHTVHHILHDHTMESTFKSVLINLGVFNEEPSSTQGAIGIYSRLQNYVPVIGNRPCQMAVYGDGLSCERGNDAQRARVNGLNPSERLEGLEPAVQEFHKEMILLQDFFDDFFKGSSAADRGTVCQAKNMFNYRQVKSDISDNFSHAWELMCLMTETFVCLLACDIQEIAGAGERPDSAPEGVEHGSEEDKAIYFQQVCKDIVKSIWHKVDVDLLLHDDGTSGPMFCCGEDIEDEVIGCESRGSCPNGEFFHYTCAGIDQNNISSPWFCSDECRNRLRHTYKYCTCKQDLGGKEPMIGCSAGEMCLKDEWYHMRCLNIDSTKKQPRTWYCSDECRLQSKGKAKAKGKKTEKSKDDFKRAYSLSLLWRGLNLLCRRDAVREGDGEAMMAFWKLDLVSFFGRKHPKYVILTHRLIACLNGWVSQRLRHDLIHNRTVNYGGGIGRNLPLDFMNEILNRLFKDLLEAAKGRYTDKTIDRCSQMIGPLGEALDVVFDTKVVEKEIYRHRRRADNRDSNVSRLIDFLSPEKLFSFQGGRYHSAFPEFQLKETPAQAGIFVGKIKQLSKKLDKRREAVLDA